MKLCEIITKLESMGIQQGKNVTYSDEKGDPIECKPFSEVKSTIKRVCMYGALQYAQTCEWITDEEQEELEQTLKLKIAEEFQVSPGSREGYVSVLNDNGRLTFDLIKQWGI